MLIFGMVFFALGFGFFAGRFYQRGKDIRSSDAALSQSGDSHSEQDDD